MIKYRLEYYEKNYRVYFYSNPESKVHLILFMIDRFKCRVSVDYGIYRADDSSIKISNDRNNLGISNYGWYDY